MAEWRTGNPPKHGYYLGTWRRGGRLTVSELWFNPDSIGTGWWPTRGYLGERELSTETIPVEAWMPLPSPPEQGAHAGLVPLEEPVWPTDDPDQAELWMS